MPFQSEKQRRYLWANEPEIARDWTETYGSRVENNAGGMNRIGFQEGSTDYLDFKTWFDKQQQMGKEQSIHELYEQYQREKRDREIYDQKHMAATGGIMRTGFAMGSPWTWLAKMISGGLKDYVTDTPSQQAWDYLGQQEYKTPDGQSIMDYGQSLYQPGGILQGYNPVSSFGVGPMQTLQKRRQYMLDRLAAGKDYSEKNLGNVTSALATLQGLDVNNPNEMRAMDPPQADPGNWSTYENNPQGEW